MYTGLQTQRNSRMTGEEVVAISDIEKLFYPILLPAKTAFLLSPLDMGAIGAFKSNYYRLDRSTIALKKLAASHAWREVSNESLRNIFLNCGIIGEETLQTIRSRFMKEVVGLIPKEMDELLNYYDAWKSGRIDVEGATRGRGITLEKPQQFPDEEMDGNYWTNYCGSR